MYFYRDTCIYSKDLEHAGMGMTIIETLADSLEIESVVNIGTKLIITKRLKDNG